MQKPLAEKYSSANLILKETEDLGALVVGDCNSAVDKQVLKPYKIMTIITVGQDSSPEKKEDSINYILHHVLDNKNQRIGDLLDLVSDQIEQGRQSGGVLVHCYTGISRSSSFVIAYLMRKKNIDYDQAKTLVKKHRPVAHPNDNFHRQLQTYGKLLEKKKQEVKVREVIEVQVIEKEIEVQKEEENVSSVLTSNTSSLSKRTFRGVKGAVRAAIKQEQSPNPKTPQKFPTNS